MSMMSDTMLLSLLQTASNALATTAAAMVDRTRVELARASMEMASNAWKMHQTLPPENAERQACEAIRKHGTSLAAALLAGFSQGLPPQNGASVVSLKR